MERLLNAIRLCSAQSHKSDNLQFTSKAAPLLCNGCGKTASLTCSRCRHALYCSIDCSRAHWKVHKLACDKDKLNDTETADFCAYTALNHNCRHGGPDPNRDPNLMLCLTSSLPSLMCTEMGTSAEDELLAHVRSATSGAKKHPQLHRVLRSCAVDAFADSNLWMSRLFCRGAAFHEILLRGGEAFLLALRVGGKGGANGSGEEFVIEFAIAVEECVPRTGLLAVLRKSMTCDCLRPISLEALPIVPPIASASASGGGGDGASASGASASGVGGEEGVKPSIESLTIKQIKAELQKRGVSTVGLAEKGDLQEALKGAGY